MSKFNSYTTIKTTNKCGVSAFEMNLKDKLISQVLTSFFNEAKYYGDNSAEVVATVREVLETDPRFIANLAVYARKEMHMRTISHVLVTELANHKKGKPFARKAIAKVVERPDDMTEILSYQLGVYGKPIPSSMKKGLADAFGKFDEYQLAKYNRKKEVKLKDIIILTHPKPKNTEQEQLFKKVLDGNLATPVTWETQLSMYGNKKEVWESLIAEGHLGYMAMLRNLRNIIESGARNLNVVLDYISNKENVLKSKQLPFRFYSAYKMLKAEGLGTSKVYDALELAIRASVENIPHLQGKTLIAADVSGSMTSPISRNSIVTSADISTLLMAVANHICDEAVTVAFDTELYMCPMASVNGIIANAESVEVCGGGTDITLPIQYLIENRIYVDRIIILSDNEINCGWESAGWGSSVPCQSAADRYRNEVNPDVWVHAIDLEGYGTQQFVGKNTNILAGWSEKILEFIPLAEGGIETLRRRIENK